MSSYPVVKPTKLEKMLFDAGLVTVVTLGDIYDVKARTSIQRTWQDPARCLATPDIHDPSQWNDKLHACVKGEFFVHVLKNCQRVLDVGCGEGWPSLYLARTIPEVVGLDVSLEHIALAKNTAKLMGLKNAQFEVGDIENLPFPGDSFDGVCFSGFVLTYRSGSHYQRMLRELSRVLRSGGTFAFHQYPEKREPNSDAFPGGDGIDWFIDGGPPILHICAMGGGNDREYFMYIKPDCKQGKQLVDLATRMSGELSDEQRQVTEEIRQEIEDGNLDIVEKVITDGDHQGLDTEEFLKIFEEVGFTDVVSWALPEAVAFAKSLRQDRILSNLQQDALLPLLRALAASAITLPGWVCGWVTCRKV